MGKVLHKEEIIRKNDYIEKRLCKKKIYIKSKDTKKETTQRENYIRR